jgi:hypothetical protein
MEPINLLLLTVHLIIVAYVFNQANKSLDNQVVIVIDTNDLKEQLEKQELNKIIEFKFKLKDSYRLEALTEIPLTMKNISEDDTIRVDWEECSITDFSKATGRVIKLTKGMTDIPQKQAESIIRPGEMIDEKLSDDKALTGNLFKVDALKKAIGKSTPFYLRVFFKLTNTSGRKTFHSLRCKFIPKRLYWPKAIILAFQARV